MTDIPRRTFLLGAALAPLARFARSEPQRPYDPAAWVAKRRFISAEDAERIYNLPSGALRGGFAVQSIAVFAATGVALKPRIHFFKFDGLHKYTYLVGDQIPCGTRAEGA